MVVMTSRLMRAAQVGVTPGRVRGTRGLPLGVVGRWVMLLVALAGLMAMHGLSDHGVGGPTAASQTPAVMAAGTADHTHAMAAGTTAAGHSNDGVDEMSEDGGAGHGGAGGHGAMLAGMCLAVIGAVLLGAIGVFWRRVLYTLQAAFGDLTRAWAIAVVACSRGPAPPDLRLLSIQRC